MSTLTSKERLQFLLTQAQADLRGGLYFEIKADDLRIIVDALKAETGECYQAIMRCAAIAERVCREHADPKAGYAAAAAIRKLAHATPLPQIPPLTSHPCDDGLRSVQCPGCLGKGCDWCNEGQQLRAAHETSDQHGPYFAIRNSDGTLRTNDAGDPLIYNRMGPYNPRKDGHLVVLVTLNEICPSKKALEQREVTK